MSPTPQPEPAEPLLAAMLLAATGGLLDAFVYLNHGHVFANAMTGNVVLLGIALVAHHGFQAIRHIAPLGAFFCGVATSRIVRDRLGRRASLYGLSLEITVLFIASLLPPAFPEMAFTALIAFSASYQITSFRHVAGLSYSSTFVTGNLRDLCVGLYDASVSRDPKLRRSGLKTPAPSASSASPSSPVPASERPLLRASGTTLSGSLSRSFLPSSSWSLWKPLCPANKAKREADSHRPSRSIAHH